MEPQPSSQREHVELEMSGQRKQDQDEPFPTMGTPVPHVPEESQESGGSSKLRWMQASAANRDGRISLAQTSVRDVCRDFLTGFHTTQENHERVTDTIWHDSQLCVRINVFLGQRWFVKLTRKSAQMFMFLSIFQEPLNDWLFSSARDQILVAADVVFWMFTTFFTTLFVLRMICIWPTRKRWASARAAYQAIVIDKTWDTDEKGLRYLPTEQWWVVGSGIALFVSTLSHLSRYMVSTDTGGLVHYTRDTRYGDVTSGFYVACRAVRCFFLLEYSMSTRYAFLAAMHIMRKCVGVVVMLLLSFVFHYYLFQAALAAASENVAVLTEKNSFFPDNNSGVFNLYVALTTANHPDVWMAMYHDHWYLMLILVSFMTVTNIFLLNVFLAVVSNAYSDMIRDTVRLRSLQAEGVLHYVYKSVIVHGSPTGLSQSADWKVQQQLDRQQGLGQEDFFDLVDLVAHSQEQKELWFALLDVTQDGAISQEEFCKLAVITRAPIVPRSKVRGATPYLFPNLHNVVENGKVNAYAIYLHCSGKEDSPETPKSVPRMCCELFSYRNVMTVVNIFVVMLPLLRHSFPTASEVEAQRCDNVYPTSYWFFYIGIFTADIMVQLFSNATVADPFYYFWPWVKTQGQVDTERRFIPTTRHLVHLIDLVFVAVLVVAVINICQEDITNFNYALVLGPLRVIKCTMIMMRFDNCRRVAKAAWKCLPGIEPQMHLFMVVYYAFAMVGCAFFAGCVTENLPNGPGDWTGAQWAGDFADSVQNNLYYYDLNFDNLVAAFVTLFMLMIQNNWHVTVDGYVKCTGTHWVKVYFVTFNLFTAMVMLNLLTGVVLDMYTLYYADNEDNSDQNVLKLYDQVLRRMKKFVHHRTGRPFHEDWTLLPKMTSSQMYSGISPGDSMKLESQQAMKGDHLATMLGGVPLPVYARTKGNKIVYCNKIFARLYGKKPKGMAGMCENYQLGTLYLGKPIERDLTHWHLAVNQGKAMYVEKGILPDGSPIIFHCSETPIMIPFHGQCTVVYMIPMHGITGGILLDMDGDGNLNIEDHNHEDVDFGRRSSTTRTIRSKEILKQSRQRAKLFSSAGKKKGACVDIEDVSKICAAAEVDGAMQLFRLQCRSETEMDNELEPDEFFDRFTVLCSMTGEDLDSLPSILRGVVPKEHHQCLADLMASRQGLRKSEISYETEDSDDKLSDFARMMWERSQHDILFVYPNSLKNDSDESEIQAFPAEASDLNEELKEDDCADGPADDQAAEEPTNCPEATVTL